MRQGSVPREGKSMRLMKANPIGYVILGMAFSADIHVPIPGHILIITTH